MRKPPPPPASNDILAAAAGVEGITALFRKANLSNVQEFVRMANNSYLHWDKLRRFPMPEGVTPNEMWFAVEMSRSSQLRDIELSMQAGAPFRYWTPPKQQEWLHRIDQDAGGNIGSRSRLVPRDKEDRFLYNSLMEEAIASSQLEGASTTRVVAKQMLRTGRKPRNIHEQMILNNYRAIMEIRDATEDELTPEFLWHIQKTITEGTLENPDAAGRFRTDEDKDVCVVDNYTQEVMHRPPPISSLGWRIDELCEFANSKPNQFIHPVVKAIILHFAIGYIHPFADGNGRTARAIFYWYMLKSGYWIFEFLPISRIVLDAPAKYARAYLYSESDSGDITYFIFYHLRVIERAVREMFAYFQRQQECMQQVSEIVAKYDLNHRQLAAANYAIQHPNTAQTFKEHAKVHNVVLATSRNDLLELEKLGILERRKYGKTTAFAASVELRHRLKVGSFRKVRDKRPPDAVAVTKAASDEPQTPMGGGD